MTKNYNISFGSEDIFVKTDAPKEVVEQMLKPLEGLSSAKKFFDEALKQVSKQYQYQILNGKEIIELIKSREYECLIFNW